MAGAKFCIDWHAGASAQVEIFSPRSAAQDLYQLKYTPAFRSTIRPPVDDRPLGPGELAPINNQLNDLAKTLNARANPAAGAPAPQPSAQSLASMEMLGNQLLDLLIPLYVQAELRSAELSLEIGVDEGLLEYPWELMHDGNEFLCLKHSVGRFVNDSRMIPMAAQQPVTRVGLSLEKLSVLLISVPRPLERNGVKYEYLPEADAETDAILQTLKGIDGVTLTLLNGKDATFNKVFAALKQGVYHIVHFNGHAHFNDNKPRLSGLVLQDQDMTTGPVVNYFGRNPPILCFVNACETAKTGTWKEHYDIFGLGRAFLDTGAYLLGSRWKINDKAAAGFATHFYASLLKDGKSLGAAVQGARIKSKEDAFDEFAWASYVLYGDPRVCFRRL